MYTNSLLRPQAMDFLLAGKIIHNHPINEGTTGTLYTDL
jgi:hypothetical protein